METPSFYNTFSFFYPLVDFFLGPQKQALFHQINRLPEGNLLDIGVGNGAHLPRYQKHRVTGIDTSAGMLRIAGKRNGSQARLLHMNGEAMGFADGHFDYVVLSHVLAVVDHPERLLEEAFRVLKPGGRIFILNHFTPDHWLKYADHAFGRVAKIFHFQSVFYLHQLTALRRFRLLQAVGFGPASYFKLLIYRKP